MIETFSYGWPDIHELRKLIPKECELKGDCKIGLLCNRHILICVSLLEDHVHLLSKLAFSISYKSSSYPMRTFKWDPLFDLKEETSTTLTWISFPSLPPNFFGKEAIFSLARVVENPLQVDMATRIQTRPSCLRVKVKVDLLQEFLKRTKIRVRKDSGEVMDR